MPIPEHVIDEVRERTDIVEVIGEVVDLKKRGKSWLGLCPFHKEKTPSFHVSPDKGMYYCFGCQAGGNALTFLMEYGRIGFPEAVRTLADRSGVEIPEEPISGPDPNAPLYAANRLAAEFYHRRLVEGPDGQDARAYLEERGIAREVREELLLGWAPDEWEALVGEAGRHAIDAEILVRAGLAGRSEKTGGIFDRFRGRLCFPVRSVGGKVIALSGRRLDEVEPKYLNSADTPIYTKGRTLYNLDLARGPIRRVGAAIVVEGNFDVAALYGAGYRNVVAPLGTAFTTDQARTLKRTTGTAYLAYDGDPAGEKAAFRAADIMLSVGFAVRVVSLPEGQDPAALIRDEGAAAFETALEASMDLFDAKIAILKARVDPADVMKMRRGIQRLMESVGRVPDPVARSLYTDRIAASFDVPRSTLAPPPRGRRASRATPDSRPAAPTRPAGPGGIDLPAIQDERYVLLHAVHDTRWLELARSILRPEFFTVSGYAEFFAGMVDLEMLRASPDPGVQRVLAELELWREEQSFPLSDASFQDSLERLLLKAVERGVLPEFQPTGERLKDAKRRSELRRAILRSRLQRETPPEV